MYYYSNGDIEEVNYYNSVLNGLAKYIYSDGFTEEYMYVDGKRVEEDKEKKKLEIEEIEGKEVEESYEIR